MNAPPTVLHPGGRSGARFCFDWSRRAACGLLWFMAPWAGAAQANPGGGGDSPPPSSPPPQPPPPPPTPFVPWRTPLPPPSDPHAMTDFTREQQLREWRKAHPLRIFFPPNPPPLGVEAILSPDQYVRGAPPPDVLTDVAEPYFPPLSTRAIEPQLASGRTTSRRLAAYRARRDTLLEALRGTLADHATSDAATRQAALDTLARTQADELARLEEQAEKLRAELADGISWSQLRTWRLGTGDLDRPREENRFLEYQVLRAAAFYEPGFAPAQRRLLREAAQILEQKVFARPESVDAMLLFPFFSPDLLRVRLPANSPASAVAAMERFQAGKAALRDELREAVYSHDAQTDHARRRAWQRLAREQGPAFDALDDLADEIRRELARAPSVRSRATPPPVLDAEVSTDIDRYLAMRRDTQRKFEGYVSDYVAATAATPGGASLPQAKEQIEARRELIRAATAKFTQEQHELLRNLARMAEAIAARLQPGLGPDARRRDGDPAEAWLMEFLQLRQQSAAAYEFDIAAFEPGLSPAQRRLLFRAACARLGLPPVGPERQPVAAPKTLLR